MFERFTERARDTVVKAQDEARSLRHNYIGTEHLLLGLLRVEESAAAQVLDALGVKLRQVRRDVVKIVGQGEEASVGQIPFTPRAKRVLDLALREALSLGHDYVGAEHILLGVVREKDGVAVRILLDHGVDGHMVREGIVGRLTGLPQAPSPRRPRRRRVKLTPMVAALPPAVGVGVL